MSLRPFSVCLEFGQVLNVMIAAHVFLFVQFDRNFIFPSIVCVCVRAGHLAITYNYTSSFVSEYKFVRRLMHKINHTD